MENNNNIDFKYLINVSIDNYPFAFLSPYTVFQACLEKRIIIPHFCYHNKLKIAGNCRACFVEEKKSVKPCIACASSIYSGSEIYTSTELVYGAREATLEYLLINHPLDCPICDQGGECDLQDQSIIYGSDTGRFYEFKKRAVENKNYSPLIKFFLNRCIHCARCTRFSRDVSGSHLMSLLGRGYNSEISSYTNRFFIDELSGNMIDLCPVGALTSKPYAFNARIWEIFDIHYLDIFDSLNSNIKLEVRGSTIIRVLPVINGRVNDEWISDKIRFNYDAYNKQRLLFCIIILNKKFYYYSWLNTFFYCKNYFFSTLLKTKKGCFKYFGLYDIKGPFLSLNSSLSVKRFFYNISSNYYGVDVCDFRNNFLPYKRFYDISSVGATSNNKFLYNFFMFGVNTRFESPVFNLKLRSIINDLESVGISSSVFSFGFSFNNSFYLNYLNNNTSLLINKFSGLNWGPDKIEESFQEKFFFFIFSNKVSIFDSYIKYLLRSFIEIKNNNYINFIHICDSSSFHSLKELGYTGHKVPHASINYNGLNRPFASFNFGGGLVSNIKTSLFNLSCYLGHHGGDFLKSFNLILPVKFFYEKSLSYINTEGYVQKIGHLKIDYRYHNIKSEKKILDIFGKLLNIKSYRLNIEKLYDVDSILPNYGRSSKNNFFLKLPLYSFNMKISGFVKKFFSMNIPSSVNDFFLSDYVSSNSITMSLCSKKFTLYNDFVYMYSNTLTD